MSSTSVPASDERSWTDRVVAAAREYGRIGPNSPELPSAVANGLRDYAGFIPIIDFSPSGQHICGNKFGLEPELDAIQAMSVRLVLADSIVEADHLRLMANRLVEAALNLDSIYPLVSERCKRAESRLTESIRSLSLQLADLLGAFCNKLFGATAPRTAAADVFAEPARNDVITRKQCMKRSARLANIEAIRKELAEHLHSAQDYLYELLQTNREPVLLPPPTRAELARRVGLREYTVSRCFDDPAGHEICVMYTAAHDLELLKRYARR